jgi:uncharacterized membrane protein YdjX (TVP38/TMEM64 family)
VKKPTSGPPPADDDRPAPLARIAALAFAVAVAIAIVLLVVRPSPAGMRETVGDVRDWVDSVGPAAPLAFVAVSASLTPLMFPGPLLAGASGLLFGVWLGFPVTLASAVLGAAIAFSISRWVAGDAVAQLAGRRLLAIEELISRRGFMSILYARIAPGVPYTLVNYAAGLTRIPLAVFVAATAIGTAPRAFAYTALGGSLGDLRSPEAVVAVCVLVGMGAIGLLLVARDVRASRRR